jgi:hypothetical protein
MSNEWIKINRNFMEWKWYDDLNTKILFLHLLLKANTKDNDWNGKKINRGQLVTSLSILSEETGLSVKQVRLSLNKLESTGETTSKRASNFRIITICNYDSYEEEENEEGKPKGKPQEIEGKPKGKPKGKPYNFASSFITSDYNDDNSNEGKPKGKQNDKPDNQNGKEEKKKENLSPTPPIKEINKRRNTPNGGLPTTTSSALNGGARKVFESFFNKTYGSAYYWSAKDAGHMTKLLKKIQFARNSRGLPIDDDSTLKALGLFLESIKDDWILQNFSVSVINSKYNEIVSQARQIGHGSNNRNDQRSLEQAQRQSEVVDLLSRLRAEDATDQG